MKQKPLPKCRGLGVCIGMVVISLFNVVRVLRAGEGESASPHAFQFRLLGKHNAISVERDLLTANKSHKSKSKSSE